MARYIKGKSVYDKPWYNSWRSMVNRCNNKNYANYQYYGGRGITICAEWNDPFVFGEWAVSNGYKKGLTLDRINTDGNYEPSNCRWATRKEQANNRRSNTVIEYNGESHNLTEWAEQFGIKQKVLINRYWKGIRPPKLFEKPCGCKGATWVIGKDGKREWVNAI